MPTIQFNIDNEELNDLLRIANEKTGTKALWFVINQFKQKSDDLAVLQREYHLLKSDHLELKNKVSEFSNLLEYFKDKAN